MPAIGYVALTAPQRPRLAQLAFLVVALFLLTNKVWSPQFSLWLVPLAVLALPHRRILLAWMTIDALVWVPRMLYLYGEQNRGLPEQWFTATVLLRDIAVMALCALVIRQIYRPELDLVRHRGRSTTRRAGCSTARPTARPAGCRSGCGRRAENQRSVFLKRNQALSSTRRSGFSSATRRRTDATRRARP